MIKKYLSEPKNLFLVDGIGALVSVILLGGVLPLFEDEIGMPSGVLYYLAAFPALFFFYDVFCFFWLRRPPGPFLQGIAYANIAYCGISTSRLMGNMDYLTSLGWVYFIGEILIILLLALWELKIAREISKKDNA